MTLKWEKKVGKLDAIVQRKETKYLELEKEID